MHPRSVFSFFFWSFSVVLIFGIFTQVSYAQFPVHPPLPDVATTTTTVYIATNGNDNNDGTLNAPLATFSAALNKLPFGTNGEHAYSEIVFLAGTYLLSERMYQSYSTQYVKKSGNTIVGYKDVSVRGEGNVVLDGSNIDFGNNSGNALLWLRGSRIAIKNLTLQNSGAQAIRFNEDDGGSTDVWIEGVTFRNIYVHGLNVDEVNRLLVQHCRFESCDLQNENQIQNINDGGWGSALKARFCDNVTFRHNVVSKSWGEGININKTEFAYVYNNVVFDNFSVNLYLDNAADVAVFNNLVYHTTDTSYWRINNPSDSPSAWLRAPGTGILVANEQYTNTGTYRQCENDYIFNNIILSEGTALGIWRGNRSGISTFDDIWFVNNTCIDLQGSSQLALRMLYFDFSGNTSHSNIHYENNIFSVASTKLTGNVRITSTTNKPFPSGLNYGYNLFSSTPPTGSFKGIYNATTDKIDSNLPTFVAPSDLSAIVPDGTNNVTFGVPLASFIQDDYNDFPRAMPNTNAGALESNSMPNVKVRVTLMLQGAYQNETGDMRNDIASSNLLEEPYTTLGEANIQNAHAKVTLSFLQDYQITDWVLLELKDANFQTLAKRAVLLSK